MSDFTVNDTMAKIRYELDDREIYNDIRSEINIVGTVTVVDVDPDYKQKYWQRTVRIPPPDKHWALFTASQPNPSNWKLRNVSAKDLVGRAYYKYKIAISDSASANAKYVDITNTGSLTMIITFRLYYRYAVVDEVSHEELVSTILTVRATDATSISKYGRRVMNLTWTEGTEEEDMQALVDQYITRYAEPVARINCVIKGSTDALRTQIITREITDIITVICTNLGLNADTFINSITITDDPTGIPVCTWGLELQRTYETLTLFTLDISELDGPHILAS